MQNASSQSADTTAAFPSPILMVLLRDPFMLTGQDLQTFLHEQLNPKVTVQGESNSESGFMITWNDTIYSVLYVSQPVPKNTFDVALQTSHGLQNGENLVKEHEAHLIISPLTGTNNQLKAIFTALGVMTLADLFAQKSSPLGFFWSNSEILADNQQFSQHVKSAGDAIGSFNQKVPNALYGLPATLFAGLRMLSPDRKTRFGAVTQGLDALTGFEIQIDPFECRPAEAAKHLFGMVSYILANGPVFQEGNTIGIEKDKNFRMRWMSAQRGMAARWVMQLEATQ